MGVVIMPPSPPLRWPKGPESKPQKRSQIPAKKDLAPRLPKSNP